MGWGCVVPVEIGGDRGDQSIKATTIASAPARNAQRDKNRSADPEICPKPSDVCTLTPAVLDQLL